MSMPVVTESPMYHGGAYASPQMPQMAATTPYGPTPYTPVMGMQQTPVGYYPQMGAMQMTGQPMMVQQPYPMYQRRSCCHECCTDCCQCFAGLFAAICVCCWCCEEEDDCCYCCY